MDSSSTRWKPVWWPRKSAPSCFRAGQTHRLLLYQAVVSSDKLSYWPAETCSYLQKNHTHVLLLLLLFLPCEEQTPKQTVTYLHCADRILNTIQQDVVIPVGEQWHMTTSIASCPLFLLLILPSLSFTHYHTISHANKHKRINSIMSTNQYLVKQRTSILILTEYGCSVSTLIAFFLHASR